jgi:20S proteasome alpha/beta subunit
MTLVVALGCTDGVILAADSAMTDEQTKQTAEKIKQLGNLPILYGSSGDVGLLQKVEEELAKYQPKSTPKRIRQELKKLVLPDLAESARLHVAYPQYPFNRPPDCVLLIVGMHEGKPWILELEKDGRDTMYGDTFGNFAAIGSGKPLAQAIMRPHLMTSRNLEQGKVFAYRVVEDAINLSASGLATPIHMKTIAADGTVAVVSQDEQDQSLGPTCEIWRENERDAVGKLFAGTAETPATEIPEPEPTSESSGPSASSLPSPEDQVLPPA